MSSQVLGARYELALGVTADALVDMHGIASGLDQVLSSRRRDTQAIASGGVQGAAAGRHETLEVTLAVLADGAERDGVLHAAAGRRRHFRIRDRGTAGAGRQAVGECVVQTELSGVRTGSILIWRVTLAIDRDPDRTPQP